MTVAELPAIAIDDGQRLGAPGGRDLQQGAGRARIDDRSSSPSSRRTRCGLRDGHSGAACQSHFPDLAVCPERDPMGVWRKQRILRASVPGTGTASLDRVAGDRGHVSPCAAENTSVRPSERHQAAASDAPRFPQSVPRESAPHGTRHLDRDRAGAVGLNHRCQARPASQADTPSASVVCVRRRIGRASGLRLQSPRVLPRLEPRDRDMRQPLVDSSRQTQSFGERRVVFRPAGPRSRDPAAESARKIWSRPLPRTPACPPAFHRGDSRMPNVGSSVHASPRACSGLM